MKRLTVIAALLLPFAYPVSSFANDLSFTGTAKPVGGGDTLYQEIHSISGSCEQGVFTPEEHRVDYRRSGSDVFATKRLSYRQSVLRPGVEFNQPDFSEVIEITNQDDQTLEILWQSPSGATEKSSLDVEPTLVADAGFDNFVRQNWKQVMEDGNSVKFNMIAPTRGDYYGFTLEPTSDNRIDAEHLVRIRPSSTLMRFLVDPILLGYNSDGLLTDYLGLTNIRKNKDTNYTAHIRYTIQATPECELTR
jgi:hypothetical protein